MVEVDPPPFKILLVEDSDADAALLVASLSRDSNRFEIERARCLAEANQKLESDQFDVVLLDLTLPDSDVERTLERMKEISSKVATIVLTGIDNAEMSSHFVEHGAQDYVPKSELGSKLMVRTIVHSIERFQNSKSLASARHEALAASHAKSNFVSAMSHEIRTPLNAILGMADLLANSDLDDQQSEYVRVFQRSGKSLLSLINSVLDLASIEKGKFELTRQPFAVRDFVEETSETFAFEAHKKRLGFTVEIAPDVPDIVYGDIDRLRQVLANLLGNAIKFTREGHVAVEVHCHENGEIQFEVRDSGIGIVADKLATIFEPFEQVTQDPAHVYGGTGLGLALCQEIVTRMSGTIRAEQAASGGAVIWFRVPLEMKRGSDPVAILEHARRVVVAISSPKECASVTRSCERAGAHVVSVGNTEDAIRSIGEDQPHVDLLITDSRLATLGGFSLLEASSELPNPPRTLALLSMDHRPGDIGKCRDLGASVFIKPVREARLHEWLFGSESENGANTESNEPCRMEEQFAGLRILHTDDSADNRLLVAAYLRGLGCELTEGTDGVEAVEAFVAGIFDIVLMDIQMPRMDGFDAMRRIREFEENEGRNATPILALTANAFAEQADKCLQAGADRHLAKPISRDALLDAILSTTSSSDRAAPADRRPHVDLTLIDPDIADLLPGYLERRRDEVDEMRDAVTDADYESLRRLAHNLKGTGGGYGIPLLTEVGARLENAASASDEQSAIREIEEIEQIVAASLIELTRLSELPPCPN